MRDPTNRSLESSEPSVTDLAASLLRHYSFELGIYSIEQLLARWRQRYSHAWIPFAIVEALYQGRYKAVSVEQILALWQRRGHACYHFNHEFERLVCDRFPRDLVPHPQPIELPMPEPNPRPSYRRMLSQVSNSQSALSPPVRILPLQPSSQQLQYSLTARQIQNLGITPDAANPPIVPLSRWSTPASTNATGAGLPPRDRYRGEEPSSQEQSAPPTTSPLHPVLAVRKPEPSLPPVPSSLSGNGQPQPQSGSEAVAASDRGYRTVLYVLSLGGTATSLHPKLRLILSSLLGPPDAPELNSPPLIQRFVPEPQLPEFCHKLNYGDPPPNENGANASTADQPQETEQHS